MDASRRGSQDSGVTNSSTRGSPASSVTHTPQDSPKRVEDNKKVSCDPFQYKDYSLQNKCRTADPDRQNMGHSGMLFFFTIYKFWQNCAWVRRVSDLILKTETLRVNPGMWIDWIPIMLKQSYIYDESTDEIILVRKPSLYLLIVVCIATKMWVNIGSGYDLLLDGTKPLPYLNQCWLIVSEILWHSPEGNLRGMLKISILDISLKTTKSKLQPHLPGAKMLKLSGKGSSTFMLFINIYLYDPQVSEKTDVEAAKKAAAQAEMERQEKERSERIKQEKELKEKQARDKEAKEKEQREALEKERKDRERIEKERELERQDKERREREAREEARLQQERQEAKKFDPASSEWMRKLGIGVT